MNASPEELLLRAFDAATGRGAPDTAAPAWVAYARSVVEERRAVLDAPVCPTAFVRRAQALFAERPKAWLLRVLELVFDSGAEPAAAHRGAVAERTLRYEAGDLAVDVEVSRSRQDRPGLFVAAVAKAPADLRLRVEDDRGASRAVRLDASGAGRVELAPGVTSAVVVLLDGEEEIARTPAIPLD